MANVKRIPEARTPEALEYMADQLAEIFMSENVSGERVAAVLKQAGSDLVGWRNTSSLYYRAQQKVQAFKAAQAARTSLTRLDAKAA